MRLALLLSVSLFACASGTELDVTPRTGRSSLPATSTALYWVDFQYCDGPVDCGCDLWPVEAFGAASAGDATIDVVAEDNGDQYTTSCVVHVVAN